MKKKTLKLVLSIMIGLFSIQMFFPSLKAFFFESLHAWQGGEDTLADEIERRSSETEPSFQFSETMIDGIVGEEITIDLVTDEPVQEIMIVLPSEASISTDNLSEGTDVFEKEENYWQIVTDKEQNYFTLILLFGKAGTYELHDTSEGLSVVIEEMVDGQADAANIDALDLMNSSETAEVANWQEFVNAMTDRTINHIYLTDSFESSDNPSAGISGLNSNSSTTNPSASISYLWINAQASSRTLIVDGNDHHIDFRSVALGFDDVSVNAASPWNITFQNVDIYHGSELGPVTYTNLNPTNQSQGRLRYHNMNNVGNQLLYGLSSTLILSGNVTSLQTPSYNLGNRVQTISAGTIHANFEINQLEIDAGATVELSTISSGNIDFHGSNQWLVIGDGAKLTLTANGTDGEAQGANILFRSAGNLTVGKKAELHLNTQRNSPAISTIMGIINETNITLLEDSTVSIKNDGRTTFGAGDGQNIIMMPWGGGTIDLGARSTLRIDATNQGISDSDVIHFWRGGTINVGKDATLDIRSDSTSPTQYLIASTNALATDPLNIHFSDAKKVNLQRTRSISSILPTTGLINAPLLNSIRLTTGAQSIQQWNHGNLEGQSTHNWQSIFDLGITYYFTTPTITSVSSISEEIRNHFRSNFTTRSQRILFEAISDVDLTINALTSDPTKENSYRITGTASPHSLIRFSGDPVIPEGNIDAPPTSGESDFYVRNEKFHVQADKDGRYSYELPEGEHFTPHRQVAAYAFLNGKSNRAKTTVEGDEADRDLGNIDLIEGEVVRKDVSNWQEFVRAIADPTINVIDITADFESSNNPSAGLEDLLHMETSFTTNPNGANSLIEINAPRISRRLIIDGHWNQIDFRAVSIILLDNTVAPGTPWDITFQNIETFHGNWRGPLTFLGLSEENHRRSIMRYHNVESVGNQLLYSIFTHAILSGHVFNHQIPTYRSDFRVQDLYVTDQANFETRLFELDDRAEVALSSIRGGNLYSHAFNSQVILGKHSTLTLNANGADGKAYGSNIYFSADNGNINVGEHATLNIETQQSNPAMSASITHLQGYQLNLEKDSTVTITSAGRVSGGNGQARNTMFFPGNSQINLNERSTLKIEAIDQGNADTDIIHFNSQTVIMQAEINVGKDAVLDIQSDSTSAAHRLIGWTGSGTNVRFNIDQAKRVNLEKTSSVSSGSLLNMHAPSALIATSQSVRQWRYQNTSEDAPDFYWTPIYQAQVNYTSLIHNVHNVVSMDQATSTHFSSNFSSNTQRLLFGTLNDYEVEVRIHQLSDDPTQENSKVITGEASPLSYIRFDRDMGHLPSPDIEVVTGTNEQEHFHIQTDESGWYRYELPESDRFIRNEIVAAYAFLNGSRASDATQVLSGGAVSPKDPLAPDQEVNPENPPQLPENQGFFSIDFISQFDFGQVPIRSSETRYPANPQRLLNASEDSLAGLRPNYVQISDRRNTFTGWRLTARLGDYGFVSEDDTHRLRGASVHLENIEMVTAQNLAEKNYPEYESFLELPPGQTVLLATAAKGSGDGTWIQRYGNSETKAESVYLHIPIGATPQAMNYQATIHWELSVVP